MSLASPFRLASTLTAPLSCISLDARKRRSAGSRSAMAEGDGQGGDELSIPPGLSLHPASYVSNAWLLHALHTVLSDPLPQPVGIVLRRAVSTAYFALFHAVTLRAADLVESSDYPHDLFGVVRRFQHRDLHRVSLWVGGAGTLPSRWAPVVATLQLDDEVRVVTDAFRLLREARIDADYNHDVSFPLNWATALVGLASEAANVVRSDAFAASGTGLAFLGMVAGQVEDRV